MRAARYKARSLCGHEPDLEHHTDLAPLFTSGVCKVLQDSAMLALKQENAKLKREKKARCDSL